MKRWPANLLVLIVRGYQLFISPMFGPSCRFHPTCSHYAIEALRTQGAFKGLRHTLLSLERCHPLQAGGYDPVPAQRSSKGGSTC